MKVPPTTDAIIPSLATKAACSALPSPKLLAMRMPTLSPMAMEKRKAKIRTFITKLKAAVSAGPISPAIRVQTWNCSSSAKPPMAAGTVMANRRDQRWTTQISFKDHPGHVRL
eukprot:Skav231591  [mRNA]  locus=scaffold232:135800:138515:- [translate_table: standard]